MHNLSWSEMNQIGLDIGQQRNKLSYRREKRGECPTCGNKVFRVGLLGKKKAPLTVDGKVLFGRCLVCSPLTRHEPPITRINQDASTVVSGITVEQSVQTHPFETDEEEEQDGLVESKSSPKNDYLNAEVYTSKNAMLMDRSGTETTLYTVHDSESGEWLKSPGSKRVKHQVVVCGSIKDLKLKKEIVIGNDQVSSASSCSSVEESLGHFPSPRRSKAVFAQRDIFFDSQEVCDLAATECITSGAGPESSSPQTEIFVDPNSLPSDSRNRSKVRSPGVEPSRIGSLETEIQVESLKSEGNQHTGERCILAETSNLGEFDFCDSKDDVGCDFETTSDDLCANEPVAELLNAIQSDITERRSALERLATMIWASGFTAKVSFMKMNGMKIISQAMWDDITDLETQKAVARLYLALVSAVTFKNDRKDILVGEEAEAMVDALLIAMQTHLGDVPFQELGCQILCCLTSASAMDAEVNDGTQSSAVLAVLNAIHSHRQARDLHEWAIRALHNQCALSQNALTNKQVVAMNMISDKISVCDVLQTILDDEEHDVAAEWICRLYVCLTSDDDIARQLVQAPYILESLAGYLAGCCLRRENSFLMDAVSFATLRLLKLSGAYVSLAVPNLLPHCIDFIGSNVNDPTIHARICAIVIVLVQHCDMGQIIAKLDPQTTVDAFRNVIHLCPGEKWLQQEALEVLIRISRFLPSIKRTLGAEQPLLELMQLCRSNENSPIWQELMCRIFATVFSDSNMQGTPFLKRCMGAACFAMTLHAENEAVQDAACLMLRNLSCNQRNYEALLYGEAVGLVVEAMNNHVRSISIQHNCCAILWNLASFISQSPNRELKAQCVRLTVQAIQNHMETQDVLEVATAALWALVGRSKEMKECFISVDDGVDVLLCVLAVHPTNSVIAENVVGIFCCLSTSKMFAEKVVAIQGVRSVVDIMRSMDQSAASLNRLGCLFFRNMVFFLPEECLDDLTEAISIVLDQIKTANDHEFIKEACSFIWTMTIKSSAGKSKIISAGGASILTDVLERFRNDSAVQELALCAYSELDAVR